MIAMGFPGSGIEKTYRNDIKQVYLLLERKHSNHYLVINLSGRIYDYTIFHDRVIDYGFPDHRAPSLQQLFSLIFMSFLWLSKDPRNVIAVHCLAGKGRTGILICCLLLLFESFHSEFTSPYKSSMRVSHFFQTVRGEGIDYKNQFRYVYYFALYLSYINPFKNSFYSFPPIRPHTIHIKEIIIENPIKGQAPTQVHITIQSHSGTHPSLLIDNSSWTKELYTPNIHYSPDLTVKGDYSIVLYNSYTEKEVFWLNLNSMYTPFTPEYEDGRMVFTVEDIDFGKRVKNLQKFPDDFRIVIVYRYVTEGLIIPLIPANAEPSVSDEPNPEYYELMEEKNPFPKDNISNNTHTSNFMCTQTLPMSTKPPLMCTQTLPMCTQTLPMCTQTLPITVHTTQTLPMIPSPSNTLDYSNMPASPSTSTIPLPSIKTGSYYTIQRNLGTTDLLSYKETNNLEDSMSDHTDRLNRSSSLSSLTINLNRGKSNNYKNSLHKSIPVVREEIPITPKTPATPGSVNVPPHPYITGYLNYKLKIKTYKYWCIIKNNHSSSRIYRSSQEFPYEPVLITYSAPLSGMIKQKIFLLEFEMVYPYISKDGYVYIIYYNSQNMDFI